MPGSRVREPFPHRGLPKRGDPAWFGLGAPGYASEAPSPGMCPSPLCRWSRCLPSVSGTERSDWVCTDPIRPEYAPPAKA
jgi:hypothetical protein